MPLRVTVVVLAGLGAYALAWVTLIVLPFFLPPWAVNVGALGFALWIAWRTWGATAYGVSSPARSALVGGAVGGGAGFLLGFGGPLLLAPAANQGPLLGLLITLPLGVFLGATVGYARALRQGRA
jgi:hypothetical protein